MYIGSVSTAQNYVPAQHCPADWPWGLQNQKRPISLPELACELCHSGKEIIFVVLLKISSIA